MKVTDPGHRYELNNLDTLNNTSQTLTFVKRVGEKYPGNTEPAYSGTTVQEVLRALIERVRYINEQVPSPHNISILSNLRAALTLFEVRAAERHGKTFNFEKLVGKRIEEFEVDPANGHITSLWGR